MAITMAATPAAAKSVGTSPSAGGSHSEAAGPNYEVTVSGAFNMSGAGTFVESVVVCARYAPE